MRFRGTALALAMTGILLSAMAPTKAAHGKAKNSADLWLRIA